MTLADLKGHLIARRANYQAEHRQRLQEVVLMESDLVRARRDAATVSGAIQATDQALADVEAAIQTASAAAAPVPPPASPASPGGQGTAPAR